jgi:uncharacterized protein
MLLYNALERTERYNMPDTLKGQHIFHLRAPYCLHSDMGRLLASITADTVGWHDTVCGHSDAARVAAKYGAEQLSGIAQRMAPQRPRLFPHRTREMGPRQKGPRAEPQPLQQGRARRRRPAFLRLRKLKTRRFHRTPLRMDTLVVLNTCQHPLDPDPVYRHRHVQLEVFAGEPIAPEDPNSGSAPGKPPRLGKQRDLSQTPLLTAMTESTLNPESAVFREVIPAGDWWVHEIKKGQTLRILDLEGNQAADTLFFSAADPTEPLQRGPHHPAAGRALSHHRHPAHEHRGQRHAHHHRRHLRPPRHARRRLFPREQHHALRPRQGMHARLPRQLHPRRAGVERANSPSATSPATSTSS